MSRKTRQNNISHKYSRRFVDDITGEVGYTDNYRLNHRGQMVKPENYDPIPSREIFPEVHPEKLPTNIRPKPPSRSHLVQDPYGFTSSYLDRLNYSRHGLLLAELNLDQLTTQISDLQSWEELDVVWNNEISAFTNRSWNQSINFTDSIYSDTITFGSPIVETVLNLPGED